MKNLITILIFFITAPGVFSQSNESPYSKLLTLADSCLTENKSEMAAYFITRYAALVLANEPEGEGLDKLDPLLHKLGLKPTAFISGFYSPEFLDWYIRGTYYMWNTRDEYTNSKEGSSIVTLSHNSTIYVGIKAFPSISQISIIGGKQHDVSSTYFHSASSVKNPVLVAGFIGSDDAQIIEVPIKNNCDGYQYFWEPEIIDLDEDGEPEILIRYNIALINGFTQKLDVFQLKNKKIKLVDSLLGPVEGLARWVGENKFQQGRSIPSRPDLGHLGYDQTEIHDYIFSNGKFVSTGTKKTVPNILLSDAFIEYYNLIN